MGKSYTVCDYMIFFSQLTFHLCSFRQNMGAGDTGQAIAKSLVEA